LGITASFVYCISSSLAWMIERELYFRGWQHQPVISQCPTCSYITLGQWGWIHSLCTPILSASRHSLSAGVCCTQRLP
jgi:hypothetical protein